MSPSLWISCIVATFAVASAQDLGFAPIYRNQTAEGPSQEVYGGKEAEIGEYLFATHLRTSASGGGGCGATLIAPKYVLTAAHCVNSRVQYAVIGSHYGSGSRGGEAIRVRKQTKHPTWSNRVFSHDIAILELETASTMPTAALAVDADDQELPKHTARLLGWGLVNANDQSDVLKELDFPVTSNAQCYWKTPRANMPRLTDDMLCGGGVRGQNACRGDSGGPLVLAATAKTDPVLVGVVSWGSRDCAQQGKHGVWARPSHRELKSFIDQHSTGHQWVSIGDTPQPATPQPSPRDSPIRPSPVPRPPTPRPQPGACVSTDGRIPDSWCKTNCAWNGGLHPFCTVAGGNYCVCGDSKPKPESPKPKPDESPTPKPPSGSWDANTVYQKGDTVTYNGNQYVAKWYTKGAAPGAQWGPWKRV